MATTYRACAKYLMVSPSKVRPVADLVRGKSYEEAYGILNAMPQKGARLILKVLESAGANAMYKNNKLDESQLEVALTALRHAIPEKFGGISEESPESENQSPAENADADTDADGGEKA